MIYDFLITLYKNSIRLSALLGNEKAKKWITGREKQNISSLKFHKQPIIVHSASLGEFEQGKILVKLLKEKYDNPIVLTFFSPSGYEKIKNKEKFVFYLPIDKKNEMKKFIDAINPAAFIFIKYEFWKKLIDLLHERKIPTYVAFARFYEKDIYFRPLFKNFYKKIFGKLTEILVQNEASQEIYTKKTGLKNVSVVGDGRVDTVLENIKEQRHFPEIEKFKNDKFLLVAGSTWEKDEKILKQWLKVSKDSKLLLIPHELTKTHLNKIRTLFPGSMFWSEIQEDKLQKAKVLVIDTIGILKYLYKYGDLCYVGGGFNSGVHNTLEPAVFAKPLAFGPKYKRFPEAVYFIQNNIAKEIRNYKDLVSLTNYLQNNQKISRIIGQKAHDYIKINAGASQRVIEIIKIC